MNSPSKEPTSYFGRKLAADPALREYCEEVARQVREAAWPDIEAGIRSEILTAADFAVTITPCPIHD